MSIKNTRQEKTHLEKLKKLREKHIYLLVTEGNSEGLELSFLESSSKLLQLDGKGS